MAFQSNYVYIVTIEGQPPAHFTWPNVAKKYIRDAYTHGDVVCLPPPGYLKIERYALNPKIAQTQIIKRWSDAQEFLDS